MANDMQTVRSEEASPSEPETLVVDLGKASKKSIKKLRHGEGKLLDKVSRAIADLRSEGVIGAEAHPVVVVVKEKKKTSNGLLWSR